MFETQPPLTTARAASKIHCGSSSPSGPRVKATLSRSVYNVRQRPVATILRKHPITIKQLEEDEALYDRNEKSLDYAMFSINNIEKPYHLLDAHTKK